MQNIWIYVVWFRDETAEPADQDYEWPAVIGIDASSATAAKEWGDHLAKRARSAERVFLGSEVHRPDDERYRENVEWPSVPVIKDGAEASDASLGW